MEKPINKKNWLQPKSVTTITPSDLGRFDPVTIPLGFRRGGNAGLLGIWFSFCGKDYLVNPLRLAFSLSAWQNVEYFFCRENGNWPTFQVTRTAEDPVSGDFIWEFNLEQTRRTWMYWDKNDYIRKVATSLSALYEYVVRGEKGSAYAGSTTLILTALEMMLVSLKDCRLLPSIHLPIVVEPFSAQFERGQGLSISIGGRNILLPSIHEDPYALRHDLEHIVFHEETSISLTGPQDETCILSIRIPECQKSNNLPETLRGKNWVAVSAHFINDLEDLEIAGFCDEQQVLSSLYGTLIEAFPEAVRCLPIEDYLEELGNTSNTGK